MTAIPLEHNYMKHYQFQQDDMILDFGALTGEFIGYYAADIMAKNIFILCIEPGMHGVRALTHAIDRVPGHAAILSCCVGKAEGLSRFMVASQPALNAAVWQDQKGMCEQCGQQYLREELVPTMSLTSILCIVKKPVNFLKADIEGAELEMILSTSDNVLRLIKNMAIAAYHPRNGSPTHTQLAQHLTQVGYEVKVEDEGILYATLEGFKC